MWRRIKWIVLLLLFSAIGFAVRNPAEKYFDIAKSLDIFATLFKEVNAYYVDEVDPKKLIGSGIEGMLESLDPYSDYISEDEVESFQITTTGQYGGIGALIGVVNKKTVITHPYKNFPAFKAGLKVGDELISVNGKSVQGKTTSEISTLLKGQPKTEIELKVRRYGKRETIAFKIAREKINITNLSFSGLVEPEIGYIRLDDFTPGASQEVSEAVRSLKNNGATKIILDLRNNPGGLLHEAVNIVGLFVPKGREVVSTKGKVEEWNKTYKTLSQAVDTKIPIVVLVSDGSASASEIVAGALQDYDRGLLVGGRTFGKGLVQTTRPLAYNSQLKVTTAKYYIPSGRCIQAMDYAHRKEDGSVERIADSLKLEFKTKNGRKVFDGGGLDPDVMVEDEYAGTLTSALIRSGLIFEFASKYCGDHPQQPDFKSFQLTDKDFEQFLTFLKEQNFSYQTSSEETLSKLVETAKKELYYKDLEGPLGNLKKKVESSKASDLSDYRAEIIEILKEQIAFHYGLHESQAEVSLHQ
ncbi:MAG TPA: S41 family peptidase, partial [Chryseolinea sp.]|nr:S41 family peptidase [Chryseolinea sp.]